MKRSTTKSMLCLLLAVFMSACKHESQTQPVSNTSAVKTTDTSKTAALATATYTQNCTNGSELYFNYYKLNNNINEPTTA